MKIHNFILAFVILVITMLTHVSCDKGDTINNEYNYYNVDTTNNGGKTTNNASNSDSAPDDGGGTSTDNGGGGNSSDGGNTNDDAPNDGGGDNSEADVTWEIPEGYSIWEIPVDEFNSRLRYDLADREEELFFKVVPKRNEIPLCFYDGGAEPTTLSFPFHSTKHFDKYPNIYVDGKFGSDIDKTRPIYCLSVYQNVAEINFVGSWEKGLDWSMIRGSAYICCLAPTDGNNPFPEVEASDPCQRTGRTLVGVSIDCHYIYLLVAQAATIQEAYTVFCNTKLCYPSQMAAVLGGNSSLAKEDGTKKVPVRLNVSGVPKITSVTVPKSNE